MSKTEKRKDEIIRLIGELFGDTSESEEDQLDALSEIASQAQSNADCLQEQIDARE